jgi:hypothetical protein
LLQIQDVLLNQIPDGTITMQKLATSLANTINGNTNSIGDLTTLATTEKTNLVGAVNEVNAQLAQAALNLQTHKIETVSQIIVASRDLSLANSDQVIAGFIKKPKRLDIATYVANSKKFSVGYLDSNGYQRCIVRYNADFMVGLGSIIGCGDDYTNYITGYVTINNDNTITIAWNKIGTMSGQIDLRIIAHYHGGA